jgi:hypothetical protein
MSVDVPEIHDTEHGAPDALVRGAVPRGTPPQELSKVASRKRRYEKIRGREPYLRR